MKVGDPRKAIGLGAVALVIVCVAVFRSIPNDDGLRSPGSVSGQEGAGGGASELPDSVVTNPFYHPKLSRVEVAPAPDSSSPNPTEPTPIASDPLPTMAGSLPPLAPGAISPKPEENAGASQKSKVEPKKRLIALEAVLRVGNWQAMISVDGGPANAKSPGDSIASDITVLEINEGAVVLKTPLGKRTLPVGQKLEL